MAANNSSSPKANTSPLTTSTSSPTSSTILGKRAQEENDLESSSAAKRKKLMEEIESTLPDGISKSRRKKMIKEKLKEKMKPEWKKLQKEKEKRRKERRKVTSMSKQELATGTETTGKELADTEPTDTAQTDQTGTDTSLNELCGRPSTVKSMFSPDASQIRVAIDLGYDDLMTDKDIKMLIKQCQRCYSINRRAPTPLQLYLTGVGGRSQQRLDQSVSGYRQWELHFKEKRFIDVFDKKDIVFLAAESPNTIKELDKDKVYVIGGLVDHNYHKGYCYDQALKLGVNHGRLPITDYVSLNSRTVLAVNHVFEILLLYEQFKDWKKALTEAIPKRKMVH